MDSPTRPAAPRAQSGPALLWMVRDSQVLANRSTKHIRRNLDQLLGVAIQPIMFMVLFVYIFGGAIQTGTMSYVNYLTPGILIQTAAFGASTTAVSLKADLDRGIVDRFRTLPMFSPALLIGHVTADLVRNLISSAILLIVAVVLGFRPATGPVEWAQALALLLLFTCALSWLSAIMGLLASSVEAVQWFSFLFVFPLTFVSSTFVPTETMPAWLRLFAENQPVTHVVEAMRAWLIGAPIGDHGWLSFLWCLGIIAVSAPVATWLFRRDH